MTKLSKRIPDPSMGCEVYDVAIWHWLKELAEYVEFLDRRDRLAYRSLREQLSEPVQKEQLEHKRTRNWRYRPKELLEYVRELEENVEYEPQTYDEAIRLCKGWRRCVVDGFVHWETPKGDWVLIGRGAVDDLSTYDGYIAAWEKDKWPALWKEMVKDRYPGHLGYYEDEWVFKALIRHKDSTPGRVVCQTYLYYRNRRDWAERLSRTEGER